MGSWHLQGVGPDLAPHRTDRSIEVSNPPPQYQLSLFPASDHPPPPANQLRSTLPLLYWKAESFERHPDLVHYSLSGGRCLLVVDQIVPRVYCDATSVHHS